MQRLAIIGGTGLLNMATGEPFADAGLEVLATESFDVETPYGICLLYTSPSPRDLSTSRMPSSA